MQLPTDFTEYTRRLMGDALYATLEKGLREEPPVSIRLNPFKGAAARLSVKNSAGNVAWCRDGVYLKARPDFTFDPLLHAGLYYVQEAASMFVDHVLREVVKTPVRMLDLCAAPGGKTGCAFAALPHGSMLFSNEPVRRRASILNENVLKFGVPDIVVTNNYACDYSRSRLQFDVVLADVPCSGEGMFRKDAGAIDDWSMKKVEECARLQREITSDIWPCLKPGGLLLYSTCTFNAHEDEENAAWIARELGADFVEIPTEKAWNITGSLIDSNPVYRFIPGKTRGEGFFLAVLRKHGETENASEEKRLKMVRTIDEKALKGLHVLSHGPLPDTIKGKKNVPDHSKALSVAADCSAYPRISIDYPQAIAYLRTEAITLPEGSPRGIVLITYHGYPLGFAKNLGSRANNLYPQAWKIKSSHLPKEPTIVLE